METPVHEVNVSDIQSHNKIMIYQAYAVSVIPVPTDCVVKLEDLKRWGYPEDIEIPKLLNE